MYVLLFGLCFHSFFIGLALGISDSSSLLIAIVAHQFFEGLALGFRIAKVNLPKNWVIWLIDLGFAFAAPLGIIVGIGIAQALENEDGILLIVTGTANAISAGILTYVSLVHMIADEMNQPECIARPALQNAMYVGIVLGAIFMTILAIWA